MSFNSLRYSQRVRRPEFSPRTVALVAACASCPVLLGVITATLGPLPAAALLLLAAGAVVLYFRPLASLLGAVGLALAVPFYATFGSAQAASFRIAALIALASGFVLWSRRVTRVRLTAIDGAAIAFAALWVLDGVLTSGHGGTIKDTINPILPLSFYFAARVVPPKAITGVLWAVVMAGAIGALTVLYELVIVHGPAFIPPAKYLWNATGDQLFRPGGVYTSPPGAITVLAMTFVCGLPLIARHRGSRRWLAVGCTALSLAACIVTFTRAGYAGLGLGVILFVGLAGLRSLTPKRFAVISGSIVVICALLFLPAVSHQHWFQSGVLRQGNLQVREGYWTVAEPIITDSTSHVLLGHGVNSLSAGDLDVSGTISGDLASAPTLTTIGPHSEYVRLLLELGLAGFASFFFWMLGGAGLAALRRRRVEPSLRPAMAGLVGAIASFAVASSASDSMRHPPSLATVALLLGLLVTLTPGRTPGRVENGAAGER